MRPSLGSQQAGKLCKSLPRLINKCISIKETWKRIKFWPEVVQSKRISEIEERSISYLQYNQEVEKDYYVKNVEAVQASRLLNKKSLVCWNRWKAEHTFQECCTPRTDEFCYGCGQVKPLSQIEMFAILNRKTVSRKRIIGDSAQHLQTTPTKLHLNLAIKRHLPSLAVLFMNLLLCLSVSAMPRKRSVSW